MDFLKSKVTWSIVAIFIIGGAEQVGWLPVSIGDTILTLLGISTLAIHNNQIKAGKVK